MNALFAPRRESDNNLPGPLAGLFVSRDLFGRLREVRAAIGGRIVFTTSFGIEDQAISHAGFAQRLSIEVMTLGTGRLFPETYELWAATERRYGVTIHALYADHRACEALVAEQGIEGFRASVAARRACCGVRKVEPLRRALAGAAAGVTGLRTDQSNERVQLQFVAHDSAQAVLKVAPLADWSRAQVVDYVLAENIPHNVLHARGFLSIGCAPCTRAVAPGEPERAGRWWREREGKKECGLHDNPRRADALVTAGHG